MRVAALYDIHGNLPALEAVLRDVCDTGVDRIVIGGDVLPGPMPRETLQLLLGLDIPTQFIAGNGDRKVLEEMTGSPDTAMPAQFREMILHSAHALLPAHQQTVARWPKTLRTEIPGLGGVVFCHATPRNDTEIFTRRTPDERLRPVFAGVDAPLVVCGHTHMQFDRAVGNIRVVNAGSVGMPFGKPGAYWLLLGRDIELRCTKYDLADAARRIEATNYPDAREFASREIMRPRSEAEMLDLYANAELQ